MKMHDEVYIESKLIITELKAEELPRILGILKDIRCDQEVMDKYDFEPFDYVVEPHMDYFDEYEYEPLNLYAISIIYPRHVGCSSTDYPENAIRNNCKQWNDLKMLIERRLSES